MIKLNSTKLEFEFFDDLHFHQMSAEQQRLLFYLDSKLNFPWSKEAWQNCSEAFRIYAVKINNKLSWSGFLLIEETIVNDKVEYRHLHKIVVDEEDRRMGIGRFLIGRVRNCIKSGPFELGLEVEASNSKAISFYQGLGAIFLNQVKGYYSTGEDALRLSLPLK